MAKRSYHSGRRRDTDGTITYDPRQTTQAYEQPENGIPEPVRGIRRSGADAGYQPAMPNRSQQQQPLRTAQPDIRRQAEAAIGMANAKQPQVVKVGEWRNDVGGDFGDYVRTPEGVRVGKASAAQDASGAWRRAGPANQAPAAQVGTMRDLAGTTDNPALMGPVSPREMSRQQNARINGATVADALRTAKTSASTSPTASVEDLTKSAVDGAMSVSPALRTVSQLNASKAGRMQKEQNMASPAQGGKGMTLEAAAADLNERIAATDASIKQSGVILDPTKAADANRAAATKQSDPLRRRTYTA